MPARGRAHVRQRALAHDRRREARRAAGSRALLRARCDRHARARENASDPKLIQRPPGFSSRLMRDATRANGSPMMSTNHGVTTVSNAPSANGGCSASPATSSSPARAGPGDSSVRDDGRVFDAARRDRKFVELDRAAGEQLARGEQQQRIEIRRDGERRVPGRVQVVREPPRSRALHERAAEAREPAERRAERRHGARVLVRAPAPVAVQVHVVVSETLLGRQPRAECLVRGLRDAGLVEAERREQARAAARPGHRARPPRVRDGAGSRRSSCPAPPRASRPPRTPGAAISRLVRPRHSASAWRGSGNSHGHVADDGIAAAAAPRTSSPRARASRDRHDIADTPARSTMNSRSSRLPMLAAARVAVNPAST